VTENGTVSRVSLRDSLAEFLWREIPMGSRDVSYSSDGLQIGGALIAGGIWLYSIERDVWMFDEGTGVDTRVARFSPDRTKIVSADAQGFVIAHDLVKMFRLSSR